MNKKWFICAAIILAILLFMSLSHAKDPLMGIVKKVTPSVVIIFTYDKNGESISQGSGFFINNRGSIITNYHIIAGAYSAVIKTANGSIYAIESIEANDPDADIIQLAIENPTVQIPYLTISKSIPQAGERIAVIGNPLGLELTVSDGIVSAVRDIPEIGKIIQITAPISPGSSGSPVVNMNGEVIAVATFQAIKGQNLNFAIPAKRITNLQVSAGKSLKNWKSEREQIWIGSAEELISQGFSYLLKEDYKNALYYFESAMGKNPKSPRAYYLAAYCQERMAEYEQAIENLITCLSIEPNDFDALLNLGRNYTFSNQFETGIVYLLKAEKLKPNDFRPQYHLGQAYIEIKECEKAVKHLLKSIHFNPTAEYSHYTLGNAYFCLENYQEAIRAYEKELSLYPENPLAYKRIGSAYYSMGKTKEELKCYRKALQIDPYNTIIHLALYWHYGDKEFSEYINKYRDEISKNPNDPSTHICLGMSYWILKECEKAKEEFKNAIRINPDDANAHYHLGLMYDELKQYTKAIESYEQAILINPNEFFYYSSLGEAYSYTMQDIKAIAAYKKSLAICPDNPPAIYRLGLAYLDVGDRNSALEQYKILKTLAPELAEALFNFVYE